MTRKEEEEEEEQRKNAHKRPVKGNQKRKLLTRLISKELSRNKIVHGAAFTFSIVFPLFSLLKNKNKRISIFMKSISWNTAEFLLNKVCKKLVEAIQAIKYTFFFAFYSLSDFTGMLDSW